MRALTLGLLASSCLLLGCGDFDEGFFCGWVNQCRAAARRRITVSAVKEKL